jgi:hypothetical protein
LLNHYRQLGNWVDVRQVRLEIQFAASELLLLGLERRVYVADIGETLGAQQRLGYIFAGRNR